MNYLEAVILAIIEGITEFLPISSTGHMIIASSIMGIADQPFTKIFTVAIQFGAILSVVLLYWKQFLPTDGAWKEKLIFYAKLLVGFIPAAVFGLLLSDIIDQLLENVIVVAITLIIGGFLFIILDNWIISSEEKEQTEISFLKAFKIGFFQTIAMIPGVSRSAATILGGIALKLNYVCSHLQKNVRFIPIKFRNRSTSYFVIIGRQFGCIYCCFYCYQILYFFPN
jgi:undecaprenyl-diphosphatase